LGPKVVGRSSDDDSGECSAFRVPTKFSSLKQRLDVALRQCSKPRDSAGSGFGALEASCALTWGKALEICDRCWPFAVEKKDASALRRWFLLD